ncbi:MAG: DUF883 domain-containing protein [Nitrospirae bacterium]|nr:DUF883 domain-containing protein [Nitrospirota bacterium]
MADLFADKRIHEALELLNEVARDKRTELVNLISSKYGHLKSTFETMEEKIQHESAEAYRRGREKVVTAAKEVDESAHKHPWPYIAGAAVTTLLLGYILGRSKH